jgi:hypothetical protein
MNPNYQELLQSYLAIDEQIQELTLKQQDLLENLPIKVGSIVKYKSEFCKVCHVEYSEYLGDFVATLHDLSSDIYKDSPYFGIFLKDLDLYL